MPVIAKHIWVVSSPKGTESVSFHPILRRAVTFDHRAFDAAYATRFAIAVQQHSEVLDLCDYPEQATGPEVPRIRSACVVTVASPRAVQYA